ncbi:alpha/beta hydrolase [Marinobacterium lutimaris]|uniref:Esterase PHB depolymerase n=1 Tax=Marinobacterium lutimaris TaxID=568106 RepID=A0A1H6DV72_9GAMM|nr:alpha/beta hydrolase [Marinobacterium lutimaris]SEG88944.1 hypothetical protein SAMN05444390_11058 [Marinobacterium lutimaris]
MRHLQKRYFKGLVPFTACKADPRFSYCAYVPECYWQDNKALPLLVVVHGSARTAESFRDRFIEFAEEQGCVILAPLFPVGAAGDADGYKLQPPLAFRYDKLLLQMVSELGEQYRLEPCFYLFGFSGGAQFAHRFLYLYPSRIKAISIAAPGSVSLPVKDDSLWCSAGDTDSSHIDKLRRVPVHLIIGEDDDLSLLSLNEPIRLDRKEILKRLQIHLDSLGIDVRYETIPEVAHDGFSLIPGCQSFLSNVMRRNDR